MRVLYIVLKVRLCLYQRRHPKLKASKSAGEHQKYRKKLSVPQFPQIKKEFGKLLLIFFLRVQ